MSIEKWSQIDEENPKEERKKLEEFRAKELKRKILKSTEQKRKRADLSYEKRISKASQPSEHQKKILDNFGVEVLPTKKLNSRQIEFILKGNGAEPSDMNEAQRAAYLNRAQKSWKGKKVVRINKFQEKGVVRYIFPKTKSEIEVNKETHEDSGITLSPFMATVDFGDKEKLKIRIMHLYYISKIK